MIMISFKQIKREASFRIGIRVMDKYEGLRWLAAAQEDLIMTCTDCGLW